MGYRRGYFDGFGLVCLFFLRASILQSLGSVVVKQTVVYKFQIDLNWYVDFDLIMI